MERRRRGMASVPVCQHAYARACRDLFPLIRAARRTRGTIGMSAAIVLQEARDRGSLICYIVAKHTRTRPAREMIGCK